IERKAVMTAHLRNLYTGVSKEQVALILLDNSMQIIEQCFVSDGSANLVSISIRKIVEIALKNNAVFLILAHNHPAGSAAPSREDMYVTKQLYILSSIANNTVVCNAAKSGYKAIGFARTV
ncbi:MAG: JAB domain-containing protein, partial [Oscillospiraceae bacterium]|nr:JAB domain-containing protein [Oscillospiraceae bacterium]